MKNYSDMALANLWMTSNTKTQKSFAGRKSISFNKPLDSFNSYIALQGFETLYKNYKLKF